MSYRHYRRMMIANGLLWFFSLLGCFAAWFDDTRIGAGAWATLIFFILGSASAIGFWRSEDDESSSEKSSSEKGFMYLCALLLLMSLTMAYVTLTSPKQNVGSGSSAARTIAPPTPAPVTPYNPGPNVTWSTIDPQPTTEEPAPTTTRPPATTTPRTTTAPRPRTTTENPPPAQQEAPPAGQPSDPGSAFGSTGQGGDEPSSGLNDQSNSGSVEQPG